MINRQLIRLKVVQMLYSYLLTRSDFTILPLEENAQRDKRYAHSLYMDLLVLIQKLAGYDASGRVSGSSRKASAISNCEMPRALNDITELRVALAKGSPSLDAFIKVLPELQDEIENYPAYVAYKRKRKHDKADEVDLWVSILSNLAKSTTFERAARENAEFTIVGLNEGVKMAINTIRQFNETSSTLLKARGELRISLDKAYDLYMSLLTLAVEVTNEQWRRLVEGKHKYLPTDADLHPDMRFAENKFVEALSENCQYVAYVNDKAPSWTDDPMFIDQLLKLILASEPYRQYAETPGEKTFEEDCELWHALFKNIILPSDDLAEALENKSVYWNDDLHIMGTFLLKTIRQFAHSKNEGADIKILPQYKDEEDSRFGETLFDEVVENLSEYRSLIERYVNTAKWDAERLAFMDMVIMMTAIAEIVRFPAIPIPVTMNEYIEIANSYSTPRSGAFINGILFSVIKHLQEEGIILKK